MSTSFWTAAGRVLACGAMTGVLAGCLNAPPEPRHPGPYHSPVDAMNATPMPYDPNMGPGTDQNLSRDLSQLRDARDAYENSQATQRARQVTRQAACREDPNARLVRIQDGSGDPNAVYCQRAPEQTDDTP